MRIPISHIAEAYDPAYGRFKNSVSPGWPEKFRLAAWFFSPILAATLKKRWLISIIAGVSVLQVVMVAAGLGGWRCPIHSVLNITCPGCGLSTAVVLLIKGNWQSSIQVHAFAPLMAGVLVFLTVTRMLPTAMQLEVIGWIAALEKRTGIAAICLMSMVVYWLLRIFEIL